ncbi:hypothetical protein [Nonomuraea cavernae]|uniref:Uncharacterized protein n=1 Tax=Nonomuraea cavernae TaxID=2045107 RepID=A0A918DRX1_9ACTN|nr:hypothetical protein [Nonomuraea cavernae]MCA2188786.1 hypothetical protein [Nonomuraea cavernae]GGO81041.1 hypothetical protein GCM10012289_69070 [Nonomuraea cavernae]
MPRDFYATVAQVLPVLLLAMLWESRFLEGLADRPRVSRRLDPVGGVRFWTRPRVRVYSLSVATIVMLDVGLCLLVLGGLVPDSVALRALVAAGLLLVLGTLLTRIWIDVIRATADRPRE